MLGELSALSASALWACASVLFTRLGDHLSAPALNLTKTTLAGVLLFGTLALTQGAFWPPDLTAAETGWLAVSGIIGLTIGDTLMFKAFEQIGPRRTLLFTALAPPLTAGLAWPVLGEPITLLMATGIVVTVGGVAWVVSERAGAGPTGAVPRAGYLFAVGAAVCQALGNVATKLGGTHSGLELSVTRVAFGVVALWIFIAWRYDLRRQLRPLLTPKVVRTVVVATLLGTYLGIWLQVTGLRYAPAGIAATLSSTSPIFILPLSALFLGERIDGRGIGAAFVAVGGIALLCLG